MIPEIVTISVIIVACVAEMAHARRCRRVAMLAFGPMARPAAWVRFAPWLRVLALAALCWGMMTLLTIEPKVHIVKGSEAEKSLKEPKRHLLILLDVSPSMRLQDAGPTGKQSRMERASDLVMSLFSRMPASEHRISVIAVYNGAKPVVVDTTDMAVIDNILGDLPMNYAFQPGQTDLFSGLEEVVKTTKSWEPKSTTVLVLSDGDTIPATGMPTMPASVQSVLVVGVGDSKKGSFIDGHQSRQNVSTLRQLAVRLHGHYHNGDRHHLPSELVEQISHGKGQGETTQLTRREYAILAAVLGALVYSLLPHLLHWIGTAWKPGVPRRKIRENSGELVCEP